MRDEIYIYHHMGLGDHIFCNAIVRNYAKLYKKIYLFAKPHNFQTINFLYRDLNNIEIIEADDEKANGILQDKKNILKIGFEKLDPNIKFDESFYKCIGMDFEKRWTDFYVERDLNREKELFEKFNMNGEYIFLHDGGSTGNSKIDINKVRKDLPIIKSDKDIPFFDYCGIIEKATEVHCINSSFISLVDSIKTDGKLFYHEYSKITSNPMHFPTLKKNWIILK